MVGLKDIRQPLPPSWKLDVAIDTGTYMSAAFTAFSADEDDAFVIAEFPNYRYVGGEIELLDFSIPQWAKWVTSSYKLLRPGQTRVRAWADQNSQFKTELARYQIALLSNPVRLELRTEITREYFRNHRIWLAPWLSVLPYEIEHATFPDDTSSAGRFERVKSKDHTLDCIEHTCSRRPRHSTMAVKKRESFRERFLRENRAPDIYPNADPHLGSL